MTSANSSCSGSKLITGKAITNVVAIDISPWTVAWKWRNVETLRDITLENVSNLIRSVVILVNAHFRVYDIFQHLSRGYAKKFHRAILSLRRSNFPMSYSLSSEFILRHWFKKGNSVHHDKLCILPVPKMLSLRVSTEVCFHPVTSRPRSHRTTEIYS